MNPNMRTLSRGRTVYLALVAVLAGAAVLGAQGGVTYEQLQRAGDDPANWITYSGQYHAQRFSRLAEIDRSNVDGLELAWVRQLPVLGQVQTSPLVVDGIMYLTTPENEVYALWGAPSFLGHGLGENPNVEGGRGMVEACEGSPQGDRSRRRPSSGCGGALAPGQR